MKLVRTFVRLSMGKIFDFLEANIHDIDLFREHALLGYYFSKDNLSLSLEFQNQYQKQWIHNQVLLTILEEISTILSEKKLDATLLKGADLIQNLYQDLGARFLSDVDILINENDVAVWIKLLEELGFQFRSKLHFYGDRFKIECSKYIGALEINFELHTKLLFHHKCEKWTLVNSELPGFKKISSMDNFIYLCGHLAHQHTFSKLYWLIDIKKLLNQDAHSWNCSELKTRAVELKLFRSVQMSLWLCKNMFDKDFPAELGNTFQLDDFHWWKKLLTVEQLVYPYKNLVRYYLLKHATKDQLREAIYYDVCWFFHNTKRMLWRKSASTTFSFVNS